MRGVKLKCTSLCNVIYKDITCHTEKATSEGSNLETLTCRLIFREGNEYTYVFKGILKQTWRELRTQIIITLSDKKVMLLKC